VVAQGEAMLDVRLPVESAVNEECKIELRAGDTYNWASVTTRDGFAFFICLVIRLISRDASSAAGLFDERGDRAAIGGWPAPPVFRL